MPAIIPAVAAYFGAQFGTYIGVGALAGAIGGSIVGAAIANKLTRQERGNLFDQQRLGLEVNREANDAPLPVVYGRRGHLGGVTCLKEISGGGNEFLNKVIAYGEGEIKGVQNTYFDNTLSTDARFAGAAAIEHYTGTDGQAASPALIAQIPAKWTSSHQGKGVAYTYARLTWNDTAWLGEPTITADILGRFATDPRDGQIKFSNNPALVIREYLTNTRYGRGIPAVALDDTTFSDSGDHCDERITAPALSVSCTADASTDEISFTAPQVIGLGDGVRFSGSAPGGLVAGTTYYFLPTGDAKGKLASSHANALAGTTLDLTSGGSFTLAHVDMPRYTCDGVVNTDEPPLDNLLQLLTSCRGFLLFSGGKYKLKIDKQESASGFVFNEDNIVGGWSIAGASKRTRLNRVMARFFNQAQRWQPDFAVQENATYRTQDNGLVLERQLDLPYTTHAYIAGRIAQLEMRQSRFGLVVSFRATVHALRCEVGDVVEITHPTPVWTLKKFRILELQLLPDDEVEVTAGEYDDSVYSLDALTAVSSLPATGLPSPFDNLAISGLTLASGTDHLFRAADGTIHSRIKAIWKAPGSAFVDHYELQFLVQSGSPNFWQNATDVKAEREGYCVPVDDNKTYYVRVRAVTSLGNKGAWSPSDSGLAHTVVGKTAAPSNVSGFSATQSGAVVILNVDLITDADLDLIEIRWADSGNVNWDDAQPITNILRGKTSTTAAVPPGEWTFLAAAKDTTGNYSVSKASANLTVRSDGFTAISATEYAPKWLGHLTNMVRHWTGVLTPESQSLASDLGFEVFDQFVPNAQRDCYFDPHSPIDKSIDAPARVWSDIVSVLGPGETLGSAQPEFQADTRLSTGVFDGYESWTVGVANFRHLEGRIHVDTTLGKPVISGFEINLDAANREEQFLNQAIGSSGTAISYSTPFHSTPAVQITALGTTALIPTAENKTATGFTAHLYNTGGAGASGNADITVTGA